MLNDKVANAMDPETQRGSKATCLYGRVEARMRHAGVEVSARMQFCHGPPRTHNYTTYHG